jgi:hypothetical protein
MPSITEGRLTFGFPNGWQASKLDNWSFYRNQFQRIGAARLPCSKCGSPCAVGSKAVDIVAIDTGRCCWIIEVKDYRQHSRTKAIDLADEIALKVRDTLAALVAASTNGNDADEKKRAVAALRCRRLRIVLHLEQPAIHSKLFPRAIAPAHVLQRLKQLVKAIDPHPLVVESAGVQKVPWSVR